MYTGNGRFAELADIVGSAYIAQEWAEFESAASGKPTFLHSRFGLRVSLPDRFKSVTRRYIVVGRGLNH